MIKLLTEKRHELILTALDQHQFLSLQHYRFNKVFLGVNGIDCEAGFTTPDEREAIVKETAMQHAQQVYILADTSKFNQQYLAAIHATEQPILITSEKARHMRHFDIYDNHFEILGGK